MKFVILMSLLTAASAFAAGPAYDELTPDQQKAVQNGEQVFLTQDVPGNDWPKAYVYQRMDATPEEAMAVFTDYNLQKSYVPNLIKSQISKQIDKATAQVDYTLYIPWPLPNENYTTQDHVSSYNNGESYRVDWTLVRADTTKSSEGNARFESLGTGTLLAYYSFVVPGSSLAGFVKGKAVDQIKDTVTAVVNQVQNERLNNRDLLDQQIQALRNALGN